jgi:ABC-type polar amino acid transport system ATPase subunit
MPEAEVDEEVTSILTDIDLLDKADCVAEKLSGGQKRKLSVGKHDNWQGIGGTVTYM